MSANKRTTFYCYTNFCTKKYFKQGKNFIRKIGDVLQNGK